MFANVSRVCVGRIATNVPQVYLVADLEVQNFKLR